MAFAGGARARYCVRVRRRDILLGGLVAAQGAAYGAVPSARQLKWHALETYAFLHFTTNTFTDKEWGYGDEDPAIFNPTQFDAGSIIAGLKGGGMKAVILTCKHHDGFCLWPTRTTAHSVKHSPFRGGKGDVVKELSEAARRGGLKFGVYLSPWDRNAASYGSPEYIVMYREQLRELLTSYGEIFEVWHDGANGGDGFYGGARERRKIDKKTYYDWPRTWDLVRKLQPDAVIFSDAGPDIRWVGNEKGIAGETCWATYDPVGEDGGPASPGDVRAKDSQTGTRNGKHWLPAECDVSIRPGWFWHEKENSRVKTPDELQDLYYKSVGRGASFLLNVPPDRRGVLHETDVASLAGFGKRMRETFTAGLVRDVKLTVRGHEASLESKRPVTFDVIRLREDIARGQRIDSVLVEQATEGGWAEIARATSVGNCRLLRLPGEVTTTRVRIKMTAPAEPLLREAALFLQSARM